MNGTILLLHLWSVTAGLFWIRALRVAVRLAAAGAADSRPTARAASAAGASPPGGASLPGGAFLAGSAAALLLFLLTFGRPLPWLHADLYRAGSLSSILVTLLFEESFKVGAFLLLLYGAGSLRSTYAGVQGAAFLAFGFAVTQNGFYFLRYPELSMLLRPAVVTGLQVASAALWGALLTRSYRCAAAPPTMTPEAGPAMMSHGSNQRLRHAQDRDRPLELSHPRPLAGGRAVDTGELLPLHSRPS